MGSGGNAAGSTAAQWQPPASRPSSPPGRSGGGGGAPGSSWTPMVTRADDARRAAAVEALGNAGVRPNFWADDANAAMKAAATPGGEGFVRSGEIGYSDRPDIAAWKEANRNAAKGADGMNIVERFEKQQRDRGLIRDEGDYSQSFRSDSSVPVADAYSGGLGLPTSPYEAQVADSGVAFPQRDIDPDPLRRAYQGEFSLNGGGGSASPDYFRAPMNAEFEQARQTQDLMNAAPPSKPVAFPDNPSAPAMQAVIEGYGGTGEGRELSGASGGFAPGLGFGVGYTSPDENRALLANAFLNKAKDRVQLAFGGRSFQ